MFSLLWSEHCGYKHSALLLKRLPVDRDSRAPGPGENAGVLDLGDGLAVAFKVESHNHPPPSSRSRARRPGSVGSSATSSRWAHARSLCSTACASPSPTGTSRARSAASATTATASACPPSAARRSSTRRTATTASSTRCASGCCRSSGSCARRRPRPASSSCSTARRPGATGSAARRSSRARSSTTRRGEAPVGADRRPLHREEAHRVVGRAHVVGPRRVAAGLRRCRYRVVALRDGRRLRHRRAPRSRAAPRGGDGALGGDDLREPGADDRDRPPADARGGRGRARPVGARARRDRRGDGDGRAARVLGGRRRRRDPGPSADGGVPALRGGAGAPPASPAREIVDAPPAHEALVELLGSPALRSREFVFRRYDQLVGSRTVRRPGLDAAVLRLRPSMRGLAVSLDGQGRIARLDPFTGGALAVLEAARNVACVGGEPIGFTDCLNFGNPEKPEIGWELAQAIDGIAAACEAWTCPSSRGTSRCTTRRTAARSTRRPSSERSGSSRTSSACRRGGATVTSSSRRSPRRLARGLRVPGSLRRARRHAGAARPRGRGAARLVPLARRPLATLVHDAAEGGLAVCLAEAAIFSARARPSTCVTIPSSSSARWAGERSLPARGRRGRARVGCERVGRPAAAGRGGGRGTLLGVALSRLRSAWEAGN